MVRDNKNLFRRNKGHLTEVPLGLCSGPRSSEMSINEMFSVCIIVFYLQVYVYSMDQNKVIANSYIIKNKIHSSLGQNG